MASPIAVELPTQFGLASVTKLFTALTVMSLVESGQLRLDLPVRGPLGTDLPLISDDVTVEQLLSHCSGMCLPLRTFCVATWPSSPRAGEAFQGNLDGSDVRH